LEIGLSLSASDTDTPKVAGIKEEEEAQSAAVTPILRDFDTEDSEED